MAFFDALKEKLQNVKKGWLGLGSLFAPGKKIDESFWDGLEEQLLLGDVGVDLTDELVAELRQEAKKSNIKDASALKEKFVDLIVRKLEEIPGMGKPIEMKNKPAVVLLVGVNGSGKTTTAAKLASKFTSEGKKVLLAAADTYRAAAIDQLKVWGEKIGVRVVAHDVGGDPAAVIYDAIESAIASDADLVIADTAGRLHTKHNLMEELKKVKRVVERRLPDEPSESLLVLDAVMGQNAFYQAEVFNEALSLTGVILAKYDNTAKGGIILAVAQRMSLPIRYVGLGEGSEDLELFEPRSFVEALLS
ncbi:MAG TPA: signal recognition particle-docking protein FtsY [Acetomicrobium hydrogeniformans]|uniref:Signal recognition particle receptor FtsY n=2 Tax=Acetomicrobium hydrogeniformans TaxID=649746 RepID=A0A7V6ZFQ9_9BACT|nr:signal recognition particle-docking protein FtsY [Acetomicrobium hydrogeniformans]HHZ05140.1 signal recognition particle-docking protein FtsY [Acetomicrobium hydrogeniformans]